LTATQQAVVTATAEYLAVFFDLPLRPGTDFDPASFPSQAIRKHPLRGHVQLLTDYLINDILWLDRPEEALICLAVTAWDLCSNDHPGGQWGPSLAKHFPVMLLCGPCATWVIRVTAKRLSGVA
jgi:hypothetical protein